MSLDHVMSALASEWESVQELLTVSQATRLGELVRRFSAVDATGDDRLDSALELADLLSTALPADHPVRRAIADDVGSTRFAGTPADQRALAEALRALLEPGAPESERAADGLDDLDREVMSRLLAAPALSERELLRHGVNPAHLSLIRLPAAGGARFPAFQFDSAGQPRRVVLAINRLLDADEDPWGVADWWLGRNAWLGHAPTESLPLGDIGEPELLACARALTEGV